MPVEGLLFIGEKGKLLSGYYGGKNLLLPEKRFSGFQAPPKTLKRTVGHYKEWIEACKSGSPTNVNFDVGSRMTEIALLGTIAARSARTLSTTLIALRITNDEEADSWLNPPYRDGLVALTRVSLTMTSQLWRVTFEHNPCGIVDPGSKHVVE